MNRNPTPGDGPPKIEMHICIPDDQAKYLPKRRRAPALLPSAAPLPRQGEVIYLSPSSAWGVAMVVHDWKSADHLRVEIWLTHVTTNGHTRPSGFSLTQ
jgi:hypothetical protein